MFSKVREVFTKEYRKETEYREFMERQRFCFKLNNNSEDIEQKVKRLIDSKFVSNFHLNWENANDSRNV